MSEREPAHADCPARAREPGRRSFLRGVLGAGAIRAAAGVTGDVGSARAADSSSTAGAADSLGRLPAVPFHGVHQAGIIEPATRSAAFASFDVVTENRAELRELLRTITAQARLLVDEEKTSTGWTSASKLSTGQRERLDAAAGQTVELLAPIPVIFEQERPVV